MTFTVKKTIISFLIIAALLISMGKSIALENPGEVPSANEEAKSQTVAQVVEQSLYLLGTFDEYTSDKVISILEASPEVELIVLTANGGSINDLDTIRLGHYIRQKGLDTHLIANGVAASGGVSLYLSGVRRSVGEGAHIGVHSWAQCSGKGQSFQCKQAKDFPKYEEAHSLHRDYIKKMLGADDFYWFSIESAPHNSIYWLSDHDLRRFQIINNSLPINLQLPFLKEFEEEYESTCHNCP